MTADDPHVSPLAALIRSVMAQEAANGNRLNYSDIARRGVDITRNNVQRYATRPLDQLIPIEKRRGLAMGLRVHPIVVDRAVAESLHLELDLDNDPTDWRTDPTLTAADRNEILAFVNGIKARRGRRSNG